MLNWYHYIKWVIFQSHIPVVEEIKVDSDLSNYATKSDLKNAACFNTSDFAKKDDFASIKSNIDKLNIDILGKVSSGLNCSKSKADRLDIHKLKPVPIDIKKLSKKKNHMQRNYIWNPAACIYENGKYLRSTIGDLVITCNGIIKATKTVQTKSSSTNFYISLAFY